MQKSAIDYQNEIGRWGAHNFEYIDKIGLGIAEEMGELCHARLKYRQNIRGKTKSQESLKGKRKAYEEQILDAIADAMIYTLHLSHAREGFVSFSDAEQRGLALSNVLSDNEIIGTIYSNIGILFPMPVGDNGSRPILQRIMDGLFALCYVYELGTPVRDVLHPTWEKVRQRDWIKFPKDGLTE